MREEGLQFSYERGRVTVQLLESKGYNSVIREEGLQFNH